MPQALIWPVIVVSLILLIVPIQAAPQDQPVKRVSAQVQRINRLTQGEIDRLKVCKRLLSEVDTKSFEETLTEIERTPYPRENLQLLEAVAKTYAEIVDEQNVVGQKKKEWLHSMITLNMAYLQLGGLQLKQGDDSALNKMIRRKLKEHLPVEIKDHQGVFDSLE